MEKMDHNLKIIDSFYTTKGKLQIAIEARWARLLWFSITVEILLQQQNIIMEEINFNIFYDYLELILKKEVTIHYIY